MSFFGGGGVWRWVLNFVQLPCKLLLWQFPLANSEISFVSCYPALEKRTVRLLWVVTERAGGQAGPHSSLDFALL